MTRSKWCPHCRRWLPVAKFSSHPLNRDGLQGWCQPCQAARFQMREYNRRWQLKQYGLTVDAYADILESQDALCAICDSSGAGRRYLDVDHDHATGAVRGLLCWSCNSGIGNFKDDPALLRYAADYLERAIDLRVVVPLFWLPEARGQ